MEQNNALAREFNAASLLRFALPNIAMMMLLSMYTIVDGMFISRFAGTTALSAINMSYPLNCLQMATGIMLGTGGSAIIARRQGEGRTDEARRNFTMLIAVALGIGLIFAVLGRLPYLHTHSAGVCTHAVSADCLPDIVRHRRQAGLGSADLGGRRHHKRGA